MELTLQQQDIYFDQQLHPDSPIYNIGAKIEVKGALNIFALKLAFKSLIEQHSTFHSFIKVKDGTPSMELLNEFPTELKVIDFSSFESPTAESENYISNEFIKPFDFSLEKHLHRFCLIKITDSFYYIFSVYHHIITDGWGTSLMFQRFTQLYNDILILDKVDHSYQFKYEDYEEKNRQYLNSPDYQTDAKYWKEKFLDIPEPFAYPKSSALKSTTSLASGRRELSMERKEYDKLINLANTFNCSVFHVFISFVAVYLCRFYSCEDVVIGLPVLNRHGKNFKNTVGLFMGINPLRLAIDLESTFDKLINQVKNELRSDYRHQQFPLGHIIRELNLGHDRNRLFNITLSYENHNYDCSFSDTKTKVIPLSHGVERVALAIYVREFDNRSDVKIDFDYSHNYFDPIDINYFTLHFEGMMNLLLENPFQQIRRIQLINPGEIDLLVNQFNKNFQKLPENKTLVDLIRESCIRLPDKVAIRGNNVSFTYKGVQELSNRIAWSLLADISPVSTEPIGVLVDRSPWMLVILIAVLKTGRAYLPLDPAFPEERLKYIIKQSSCKTIIADDQYTRIFNGAPGFSCISTHILLSSVKRFPQTEITKKVGLNDLAYIIYTSGSTGQPKGVEITHRSLLNFLLSMQTLPGMSASDRLLAVTTYSFDISILELFLPIITGATVFVADQDTVSEPILLTGVIKDFCPTIMQATPSLWQMLFFSGWEGDAELKILCGGERLNMLTGEKLIRRSKALWNMYGPTETTIWSTIKHIKTPAEIYNIGKPINNTLVYILDKWLQPVPKGAIGEIYIGGAGVSKGYRFRDDLTRERFISSPFIKNDKIYKTGDIGKWTFDGEIELLGRRDSQVKIRGYRIEIAEIESKLLSIDHIKEAAVVVHKDKSQNSNLVAFLVSESEFDRNHIIDSLKGSLPSYMIPAFFIPVEEIPLTPNGKVDRNGLMKYEASMALSERDISNSVTSYEMQLAKLWQNLLGIEEITTIDNFFHLGGQSIKSAQLVNHIQLNFGVRLDLSVIFANPTIKALAGIIAERQNREYDPIKKAISADSYELSPSQKGMWLACQKDEASIAYNMSGVYRLKGKFSKYLLNKALENIVSRHESLRTIFVQYGGSVRQKILENSDFKFEIYEYILKSDSAHELNYLIESIVNSQFDFERGPLIRVCLIELLGQPPILVFVVHHLIADGWSLKVLLKEVSDLYKRFDQGAEAALPSLSLQFRDYSEWLNSQIGQKSFESHKKYWRHQLTGYNNIVLMPRDRQNSETSTFNGRTAAFSLGPATTEELKVLSDKGNVTLFMVLLAILKVFLFRITGKKDICVGMPTTGRQHADLEDQIGMYINTVPLRTFLEAEDRFFDVLKNVKKNTLGALEHQILPLTEIIKEVNAGGLALRKLRLFDIVIVFQEKDMDIDQAVTGALSGLHLEPYPIEQKVSRFPITFNFFQASETINCNVEYNTDLFRRETILKFIENYKKTIDGILKQPDGLIMNYDLDLVIESKPSTDRTIIDFNF